MGTSEMALDRQQAEIAALGPWFHNLHLPSGLQTMPEHWLGGDFPTFKWRQLEPHIPASLAGWRVLDIGCNAGFYSLELARRGASVVAIDSDPHYLRQAQWATRQFGLADRIELRQLQVYELAGLDESFDLVWFMGVFYHLRYPLLALDTVARLVRRQLVFQTLTMPGDDVYEPAPDYELAEREVFLQAGWPRMAFIEKKFAGDPTNWWAANHAAVEALLRSANFRVVQRPADEIYICEPQAPAAGESPPWERAEYRAVTRGPRADQDR